MKGMTIKPTTLALFVLIVVGFWLRVSGIRFGLPDLMHPDEARIILDSMSMGQRMSLIPEDINYPLFHKYLLLFTYGIYYLFGILSGFFMDKIDFAVKFLFDPSPTVYISRLVTSIIGTLIIPLAYFWGKIIKKSEITGIFAALFVAIEWQLVLESQYAIHQTLSALSATIAFFGMSMICINNKSVKSYVWGGLTLGFALASHQTTVLLFPGIIFLIIADLFQKNVDKRGVLKNWFIYSVLAILVGILGNLNWIFRFEKSLNFFLQGSGAGKVAFSSSQFFDYDVPSIAFWYFFEMIRRNYLIGLAVLVSWLLAITRRKKIDILYIITALTYFIFFHKWTYRWIHLFVGLIPISLMFAADQTRLLAQKLGKLGWLFLVGMLLLSALNISDLLRVNKLKQTPETRQLAREWILDNVPEGTKIAIDYPAYSVSLPSDYPTLLRNRVAKKYYNENIPVNIKQGLVLANVNKKRFEIEEMIDSKSEPIWPPEMPIKEIEKAKTNTTLRDVYAYFNFKPINELIAGGVKYFVLDSYTYGMSLLNNDPRKLLMNYYIKDDVLPFAYQDGNKSQNPQHDLMYYVVKREREYFLDLLDNRINGISLVKEIYPNDNLGPVIKIYKVD